METGEGDLPGEVPSEQCPEEWEGTREIPQWELDAGHQAW